MPENESRSSKLIALLRTTLICVAIIGTACVLGKALLGSMRIKHQEQRVTVTGSSTRRIHSDFIVWEATVRSQDVALTAAYKKLSGDVPVVVEFLKARGVKDTDIKVRSTTVTEIHPRDVQGNMQEQITALYITEQSIQVSSNDIAKVEQVSRDATQLIDQGVYIHSEAPLYIYTNLGELKIQLLAEASKDARLRAEQIAANTGAQIAGLISAKMGVMQVNPAYSTDVSWDGNNDKTSLEKDAMAIVSATFAVK